MSGPEWTPEQANAVTPGHSLSVESSAPRSPVSIGANPFGAERAWPVDPRQVELADHEAQANLESDHLNEAGGSSKLASLLSTVKTGLQAALSGLFARLRRQPVDADTEVATESAPKAGPPTESAGKAGPPTESAAKASGHPPAADASPAKDDEPPRFLPWSPASWAWETRVGMAAVVSFSILVGVLVIQKARGNTGKTPPVAQIPTPKSGDSKISESAGAKPTDGSVTPPLPTLASVPPQAGTGRGKAEPPQPAPNDPPTPVAGSSPGGVTAPTEPQSAPNSIEPIVLASTGDSLTKPIGGEPAVPPAVPGSSPDALPLPTNPAGEASPALPATEPLPTETAPAPVVPPAPIAPEAAPKSESAELPDHASPPPVEPAAVEATPPPPTESPKTAPAPDPQPAAVAAPLEPVSPSRLESIPSTPPDAPSAKPAEGWIAIPSGGKRPGAGSSPPDPGGSTVTLSRDEAPSRARMADGAAARDDAAVATKPVATELHMVQPGENFWTISKDYYNSHRYYKALYKANAKQVPNIKELYVGTVIRVPPPEALDRSLVESLPPTDGAAVSQASAPAPPRSVDPGAGAGMAPTRSTRPGLLRARSAPATEAPRRPTYRVKSNDTLRSIARDTLDDPHRAGEIFDLNRDNLDDPKAILAPGTSLTLPEDAVIGRGIR